MEYEKLSKAEQRTILENTLHQAEADHFRATLELEAAPEEVKEALQGQIDALEERRALVSGKLAEMKPAEEEQTPETE
jgi:hypothetical protein